MTTGKLSKLEHFETDEKVLERSSVNLGFQYYAANLKSELLCHINCKYTTSLMSNAMFELILSPQLHFIIVLTVLVSPFG